MEGITVNGNFIACNPNEVSDGYHTFGELYDHRCLLFTHLMWCYQDLSFASHWHSDGTVWDGWFIAGIKLDGGMITYHLPDKYENLLPSSVWVSKAPEWDGHTSSDVVNRLIHELTIKKRLENG
jgi:hypothetical protein